MLGAGARGSASSTPTPPQGMSHPRRHPVGTTTARCRRHSRDTRASVKAGDGTDGALCLRTGGVHSEGDELRLLMTHRRHTRTLTLTLSAVRLDGATAGG